MSMFSCLRIIPRQKRKLSGYGLGRTTASKLKLDTMVGQAAVVFRSPVITIERFPEWRVSRGIHLDHGSWDPPPIAVGRPLPVLQSETGPHQL